eukprot:TRINITY_DN4073_c0_g2_i3.p1 TRINITY_DN4073_c0_g2~~TRINITY_DN4073_c0_g2_i3.p1  ORF type:complete len:211 (+),score=28.40 TRINITY_DN4073_c0_g2_i3:85-633(+)
MCIRDRHRTEPSPTRTGERQPVLLHPATPPASPHRRTVSVIPLSPTEPKPSLSPKNVTNHLPNVVRSIGQAPVTLNGTPVKSIERAGSMDNGLLLRGKIIENPPKINPRDLDTPVFGKDVNNRNVPKSSQGVLLHPPPIIPQNTAPFGDQITARDLAPAKKEQTPKNVDIYDVLKRYAITQK